MPVPVSVGRAVVKPVSEKTFGLRRHIPDFSNAFVIFRMATESDFYQFDEVINGQSPIRVGQVPKPNFLGVIRLES